jgi:hypothetical protein
MKADLCGYCGGTIHFGNFYEIINNQEVPRPDVGKCDRCGVVITGERPYGNVNPDK